MSHILTLPAIVRVAFVFTVILILIRRKVSLGTSFLIGTIILGFGFGLRPGTIGISLLATLTDGKTLSLAAIVSLILVLSSSMEEAGQMERLLATFQGLISRPLFNLIIFPALIGLLPMPGGAIFSAPMVKHVARSAELSPDELSYVNYWFRHIWEYWWPLYPGVLLGTTLAGINVWTFVITLCPLTAFACVFGAIPIRAVSHRHCATTETTGARSSIGPFIRELVPIIIVIIPGLILGLVVTYLFPGFSVAKESALIGALIAAIFWIWHDNALSQHTIRSILANRHIITMIYMIFAILMFKGVLQDSQAVSLISNEFRIFHIPLILIVVLLPMLVGTVVGISIAFVGATFPILISLIVSFGEGTYMLPYMMLAMMSGFTGIIFSPLHICFLLSNQYFGTSITAVYRYLCIPSFLLFTTSFLYFWLLRFLTNMV